MTAEQVFEMNKFGRTLTDRPDGKKAYADILGSGKTITTLDFRGVMSLGSSFGDEIVPPLARANGNTIAVKNANMAIRDCLQKIVEDTGINVEFES